MLLARSEHSTPYTIELYGMLPAVVALLALVTVRSEDLSDSVKALFLCMLVLGSVASTKSLGLLLVAVAIVLEKGHFHHPLVAYLGAVIVGCGLVGFTTPKRQPVALRAAIVLLSIGLGPTLFPEVAGAVFRFQVLVAALALLYPFVFLKRTRFLSNPLAALQADMSDNRERFELFCLAFLSYGTLAWSYATREYPEPGVAAVWFLPAFTLSTALLLRMLGVKATLPSQIEVYRSDTAELELQITAKAKELVELQHATATIEQQNASVAAKQAMELETRRAKCDRELALKAQEEERKLADQRRSTARELERNFYSQPWDPLVATLCDKPVVTIPGGPTLDTTNHLLIGTRKSTVGDYRIEPVFIHRDILYEHILFLGGTGSGKTSLGILPIATQLLRSEQKSPVVVLDLKGDKALFHSMREEAERNNQDFLFFSLESNKATYRFNPFVGIKSYGGTKSEQAQPLLDALGLNHGDGYGRTFFTRLHRQRLFEALAHNPNIHTFAQLKDALNQVAGVKPARRPVPVSSQKDELIAAIEGVADYPQLFTTPADEAHGSGVIQFDRVLENNQVVYFWLPAPTQSISVREIGKLVLYNLFFAALKRSNNGKQKQTYLFIDEFQRLIGENLALFLEQSRSYGIGLTLANQNIDQLNTHDAKLWPLVQSNVRASFHFGSGDPKEVELLSSASGETRDTLAADSVGGSSGTTRGKSHTISRSETSTESFGTTRTDGRGYSESENLSSGLTSTTSRSHSYSQSVSHGESIGESESHGESESQSRGESFERTASEYIRAAYRPEDVRSVFNKQGHFFYWVRRGCPPLVDFDGKPIEVKGIYTIPKHLYERRKNSQWPKLPSVPGHTIQTPNEYKSSSTVTDKAMVDQFLSVLTED